MRAPVPTLGPEHRWAGFTTRILTIKAMVNFVSKIKWCCCSFDARENYHNLCTA